MTPFAAVLSRLGLSQSEAARELGVSLQTIRSASISRRSLPEHALAKIPALARRLAQQRADDLRALAEEIEAQIQRAA